VTVVSDTNVLVASLVAKGLCHEVVVRALGSSRVVTSPALLDELERTLRAKFRLGPASTAFLEQLRLRVQFVVPTPLATPVSRDADDDVVLATAVAANATVIVTGDQHLLTIRRYNGVDIISPRDFLTRLPS
jgi:putative PIN family toxin of toxin-antitoxin system